MQGLWAVGAGVVLPGLVAMRVARLLGASTGATALDRLVVGVAAGRVLLAAVALAAASAGRLDLVQVWAALACVAAAAAFWRGRRPVDPGSFSRASLAAGAIVVVAAAGLVEGVLGRSAGASENGDLHFYGRFSEDALIYRAVLDQIAQHGFAWIHPFVDGLPVRAHYVFYGWLVGLHALGADGLALVFRIRPHLDVAALGLTVFALVRALGGGRVAGVAGALFALVGGGVSEPVLALLRSLGADPLPVEVWGFGTSFALPFNPIAPALQAGFAACVLLARGAAGPAATRHGVAAGLLVASVFETKLFLWPSLLGALVLVALVRPPPDVARGLRAAAAVGVVASVPLVIDKVLFAASLAGRAEAGIALCVGCLPRFLAATLVGDAPRDLALFEDFTAADLLDPTLLLASAGAALAYLGITLGVRLAAVPEVVARCRGGEGGGAAAAVHRLLGVAAVLGAGAACAFTTPPHPFNAAQFAWSATFGLCPALGLLAGRWIARRRWLPLFAVGALALSSSAPWWVERGLRAPLVRTIEAAERELLEGFRAVSGPDALVLEPSMWIDPRQLSAVPILSGRRVYLSKEGVALYLDPEERAARTQRIEVAFGARSASSALAAIRATGATHLYVPRGVPVAWDPGGVLDIVAENAAGAIYAAPR